MATINPPKNVTMSRGRQIDLTQPNYYRDLLTGIATEILHELAEIEKVNLETLDEEDFQQVRDLFERVRNVLKRNDVVEKFALVHEVTQGENAEKLFGEFFDIFLLALRYTMIAGAEEGESPQKLQSTINVIRQTQESVRLQKRNVNARLLFEHLMRQT